MNATAFSADSRSMVRRVSRSNGLTLRGGDPARPSQMNDVFAAVWPCAIVVCASLLVRGMP